MPHSFPTRRSSVLRAAFATLAYQTITAPGSASTSESKYATGLNLGTGVKIQGTARIDTQGDMQTTGNALDLALDGDGYFQVQLPGGQLGYTRSGNFRSEEHTSELQSLMRTS